MSLESDDAQRMVNTTTTHSEWGAGHPRLRVSSSMRSFVFDLTGDRIRIGAAEDNELRLEDSAAHHAVVHHDENDEYVLTLLEHGEMNAQPDTTATPDGERAEILRTGAHFTVGPWTLVFARDEFADHGRPYGGRQGGEGSDQPAQPPRPDYVPEDEEDAAADEPSRREE